jgi:DNA topoisomerase-1
VTRKCAETALIGAVFREGAGLAKSLVIVESPAKARTINKFLGKEFVVKASMGHVRDLPKSKLGVDEENFEPTYTVLPSKKKIVAELKKAAQNAAAIYLAPDPDREGEAICWHLSEELKRTKKNFLRVEFNEITKKAILAAIEKPGPIDVRKVDAQQARRILDRLVGYKISPLLWEKVRRGLSAGRVQSVALRIIVEREREIRAFKSEEYWSIVARLADDAKDRPAGAPPDFEAKCILRDGKKIALANEAAAHAVLEDLEGVEWSVTSVTAKEKKKNPPPPFITSKLQQDAARRHSFPVSKTMRLAQALYEGKEVGDQGSIGLITYMRTDSTRVSQEALSGVRDYIRATYGAGSLPDKPRYFRSGRDSQDAHEAIRPTSLDLPPQAVGPYLSRDELKLYTLIWNRFVASQMEPALFDTASADIAAGRYTFRANGQVMKSAGWLAVYQEQDDNSRKPDEKEGENETALPALVKGQPLRCLNVTPHQHFTQPPPRFSEATLVKELEENGIGRPSTYAKGGSPRRPWASS